MSDDQAALLLALATENAELGKPNFVIFTDVDVSGAKKDVKEAAAGFISRGIPTGREHGAPFICHRKGYKSCLIDGSTIQEIEPEGRGPRRSTLCSDG